MKKGTCVYNVSVGISLSLYVFIYVYNKKNQSKFHILEGRHHQQSAHFLNKACFFQSGVGDVSLFRTSVYPDL